MELVDTRHMPAHRNYMHLANMLKLSSDVYIGERMYGFVEFPQIWSWLQQAQALERPTRVLGARQSGLEGSDSGILGYARQVAEEVRAVLRAGRFSKADMTVVGRNPFRTT